MAYIKKSTDDIANNVKINFVQNVDEINDVNVGSALDTYTTAIAQEIAQSYENQDEVYNASRITYASDDDLEQLGLLVGIERNSGSRASGYVTFIRNSAAESAFNISAGSIISTQPNTELEQLKFIVNETKTFPLSISYSQEFKNGIYKYRLDERFIDSISSFTGTTGAAANNFIEDTDYSIEEDYNGVIIDISTLTTIDDCSTVADWTEDDEALAPTQNTGIYLESGGSINMQKSGTTSSKLSYYNTLSTAVDITNNAVFYNVYILDETTLAKIKTITCHIGSGGALTNSYSKAFTDLTVGWNQLKLDYKTDNLTISGNIDIGNVNYLEIEVETNSNSDTFAAGDLLLDFIFMSQYENYYGDVIVFDQDYDIPDNATDFIVTYVPLSVDVEVQADSVGVDYNVNIGKIVYKVSSIPNVDRIYNYEAMSNGIDKESDTSLRDRIQNASSVQNVATAEALKYNVLALEFVRSCTVIDLPEYTAPTETFTYSTGTDKYALTKEVAQDDDYLTVSGIVSSTPTTFTKNVDYILNDNNEIDFSVGGDNPDDATDVEVDYKYKWLGHVNVFVVGKLGELTSTQLTEVEEVVEEKKSVGVVVTVTEPTYISVDISAELYIDDSYTASNVIESVETAISDYLDTLDVGDNVLFAGIINIIMDVSGVTNVTITDIGGGGAADLTIDSDEIAKKGTLTIIEAS